MSINEIGNYIKIKLYLFYKNGKNNFDSIGFDYVGCWMMPKLRFWVFSKFITKSKLVLMYLKNKGHYRNYVYKSTLFQFS